MIDKRHDQINVTIGLEKTRELRRAYYAAVSFVDSELGRVISEVATILVAVMMVAVVRMVVLMMVVMMMVKMFHRPGIKETTLDYP